MIKDEHKSAERSWCVKSGCPVPYVTAAKTPEKLWGQTQKLHDPENPKQKLLDPQVSKDFKSLQSFITGVPQGPRRLARLLVSHVFTISCFYSVFLLKWAQQRSGWSHGLVAKGERQLQEANRGGPESTWMLGGDWMWWTLKSLDRTENKVSWFPEIRRSFCCVTPHLDRHERMSVFWEETFVRSGCCSSEGCWNCP